MSHGSTIHRIAIYVQITYIIQDSAVSHGRTGGIALSSFLIPQGLLSTVREKEGTALMREKPIYLTLEGRDGLTEELNHLRDVRRPEVAENIRIAKEYADTMDNADFDQAKNEQAFVEGRILTLENLLSHAVMIDPEHVRHDVVSLGVKVEAVDEEGQRSIYAIVGSAEANPVQGKISNESPLGQALLGKQVGDVVEFTAPAGVFHYTIVNIE